MAAQPKAVKTDRTPGVSLVLERRLEEEAARFAAGTSWKQRMDPPVARAAAFRLPDEALTADEDGGEESVGFLVVPRDGKNYHYLVCRFRGPDIEDDSVIRDVKEAQLRRWQASDW